MQVPYRVGARACGPDQRTADHGRGGRHRAVARIAPVRQAADFQLTVNLKTANARGVCTEKLDSDVLVMKPANQGMRHDASNPLNWARDRRILV